MTLKTKVLEFLDKLNPDGDPENDLHHIAEFRKYLIELPGITINDQTFFIGGTPHQMVKHPGLVRYSIVRLEHLPKFNKTGLTRVRVHKKPHLSLPEALQLLGRLLAQEGYDHEKMISYCVKCDSEMYPYDFLRDMASKLFEKNYIEVTPDERDHARILSFAYQWSPYFTYPARKWFCPHCDKEVRYDPSRK